MEEDPRLVATAMLVMKHWREEAERGRRPSGAEEDKNDGIQYSG